MDPLALAAFDEATRTALFAELDIPRGKLVDLGGFESFVFRRTDTNTVLRVTHQRHRDLGQILAELHWIECLGRAGAAVCRPVPQGNGELARAWRDFVISEFPLAPGRPVVASDWNTGLFVEWGRCIGQFHRVAQPYTPPTPQRPDCTDDSNFDLPALMPAGEPKMLERAAHYKARFLAQPRRADDFGLIHSDAHAGNFFVDNGKLTFFDFDDACYCWFAYDVATILFSAVLQQWIASSQHAREEEARRFLPAFLEGYRRENELAPTLIDQLPLALKFREICLYGVITSFVTPAHRNWYTEKFMDGRRQRIERDEPYLRLDFL